MVFTRNAQDRRLAETHAEKDRAKLFLQFSEANISSNFLAALYLHSKCFDHRDFRQRYFHWLAKTNDPVC